MAITPHPPASYQFCFRRVVKFLGVADPNSPEGDLVMATSPYTQQMIKSQICQSYVEVCSLEASVEGSPYRNKYFTETPDTITSGSRIPGYIGVHGGVQVLRGTIWEHGQLAQSLAHVQRMQDKYRVDPSLLSPRGRRGYWIDNGTLVLAVPTASGRVYVPTIPIPDDTAGTPTLATPKARQNAVIAHAVMTLNPVGADQQHRVNWSNIFSGYLQMIMSGNPNLPDPEAMARLAE